MILINKHTKLSRHMASMFISDRRLINHVMLIYFGSAKFLLKGVNVVHFSNDYNMLAALSVGAKTNLLWNLWIPFFEFIKVNLGLGGRRSEVLQ